MSKNGRLFWRNTDDIDPTPILDALAREQGDAWEARQFAALWKETARRAIQSNAFLDSAAAMEQQMAMSESLVAAEAINRAEKAEQERDEANDALAEYVKARVARDPLTAREHLDAAWEAAHVVPAGTAIAPGVGHITRYEGSGEILASVEGHSAILPTRGIWGERRLLDPPAPSRPDGAEEIEAYMREMVASHPEDHYGKLADHLASRGVLPPLTDKSEPSRGVRVTGAES